MKMINLKRCLLAVTLFVPAISYAHSGADFFGGLTGIFHDLAHSIEWGLPGGVLFFALGVAAVALIWRSRG